MPFDKTKAERIIELFNRIEGRKEHDCSAPTYKDSEDLKEMARLVTSEPDRDIQTMGDKLPVLWYLAESYDKMSRAGVSSDFYKMQLEAYVRLMRLKNLSEEEKDELEDCFYKAVKARNFYEADECDDLVSIVSGCLDDERIQELKNSAIKSRAGFITNDPVEKTEQYLAVIDEVERKIAEEKSSDFCLEYWNLKASILFDYGVFWRSPASLNPDVLFD